MSQRLEGKNSVVYGLHFNSTSSVYSFTPFGAKNDFGIRNVPSSIFPVAPRRIVVWSCETIHGSRQYTYV